MNGRRSRIRVEDLVRQRGIPPQPKIDPLAMEVRSCSVSPSPHPVKPEPDGILGGIVVIWEYSLPLCDVQEFHDFLRKEEVFITESIKKLTNGPFYRGTYMMYGPGDPRYRTIWAYESLDAMGETWRVGTKNRSSNFYKAVRQLRAYWLRDPNRSEARWVPARLSFDPDRDQGDGFAKLTLDAFKLNSGRKR